MLKSDKREQNLIKQGRYFFPFCNPKTCFLILMISDGLFEDKISIISGIKKNDENTYIDTSLNRETTNFLHFLFFNLENKNKLIRVGGGFIFYHLIGV